MRITQPLIPLFIMFLSACASESDSTPPSDDARLLNVQFSHGPLDQYFYDGLSDYTGQVGFLVASTRLSIKPSDPSATVAVNGSTTRSGQLSDRLELIEGENTIDIKVTAEDGTTTREYQFIIRRETAAAFAQQAYIKASNPDVNDNFSYGTVALDGDTLVVGAQSEDSNATGVGGNEASNDIAGSGAVYVFTLEAGVWSQQAYVKASNTGSGDLFGRSLALSDDTLVVGARSEDSNVTGVRHNTGAGFDHGSDTGDYDDSGAVYVFTRSAGVWSQQAYIKASNAEELDYFGSSLALDGDTLAVGAPKEDSSATDIGGDQADDSASGAGAVYVFTRSAGVWSQQSYLKASNADPQDFFGTFLAIDGDTLVVGAEGEDSNATGAGGNEANNDISFAGAVYVFNRAAGTWSQQAYLKASNPGEFDSFGWSFALDADTLAVGAYQESSDATGIGGNETNDDAQYSGAVYVFTLSDGAWSQQAYLKASNTDENDGFGYSVALDGNTLAVGAYGEDSNETGFDGMETNDSGSITYDSGAVYLFTRSAGTWSQQTYIKASNTGMGDWFGFSVALDGDTLAVGATRESSNATGVGGDQFNNLADKSGAMYIFE
jgi:hypothetical protein